jgi:hypothetical protein
MSARTPGAIAKSMHRSPSQLTPCLRSSSNTCSAINALLDGAGLGFRLQMRASAVSAVGVVVVTYAHYPRRRRRKRGRANLSRPNAGMGTENAAHHW